MPALLCSHQRCTDDPWNNTAVVACAVGHPPSQGCSGRSCCRTTADINGTNTSMNRSTAALNGSNTSVKDSSADLCRAARGTSGTTRSSLAPTDASAAAAPSPDPAPKKERKEREKEKEKKKGKATGKVRTRQSVEEACVLVQTRGGVRQYGRACTKCRERTARRS
eukprot:3940649-Rhodomonas_salina.2